MRLIEWLYQINLMWMLATWCEWSSRHDQHDEINKMKTGNPKDFTVEIKQHHLMMWFPKLNSGAPDSGRRCHAVLAIRSNTSPTLTTASVCLPPRLSSALRYSAELQCWATVLRLLRDLRDGPFSKALSTWNVKPSRLQFCLEITWVLLGSLGSLGFPRNRNSRKVEAGQDPRPFPGIASRTSFSICQVSTAPKQPKSSQTKLRDIRLLSTKSTLPNIHPFWHILPRLISF